MMENACMRRDREENARSNMHRSVGILRFPGNGGAAHRVTRMRRRLARNLKAHNGICTIDTHAGPETCQSRFVTTEDCASIRLNIATVATSRLRNNSSSRHTVR